MRAIEKKRPPFMTPRRWLLFSIVCLAAIVLWLGLYYRTVQSPKWLEDEQGRSFIAETGELKSIDELQKHVWDAEVWVARGLSEDDTEQYVFVDDEGKLLYVIAAAETITAEEIKTRFENNNREGEVIRVMPAWFRDAPAWELYYKQKEDGRVRYRYQFLTFDRQPAPIDTYTLPSKTGP